MDHEKDTVEDTSANNSSPATSDLENNAVESKSGASSVRTIGGIRWVLVCIAIYVSTFLYGLDTTIAADVQGSVVEAFSHVEQLAWIGAGFPLGSVSVLLLNGVMYNTFDMKWIYIASLVQFEVGSALCGAAPSMTALIIGRIIAGAGGSGIYMGCLNYFSSLTSPEERGLYITGTGFFWGIGAVLGPVVGGSFVESNATWRWAFYINLVIGAVFAPVYLFGLPSLRLATDLSILERIRRLDFLGFFLGAGVWVSFTMAFTMAGGQWGWNDGRTIGTIVTFIVVLVVFAIQQTFCIFTTLENRSFPVYLLRSRTQVLLYISAASTITSLFVIVYFIPIYFQFVHNDSALQAAIRLLPFVIVTVCFNLGAGHLLSRIRYYMPLYVVSGVLMTIGAALLTAYLSPKTPPSYIYGFTIITGVGSGLTLQAGYALATIKAPKHMGDALALQNIAQLGATVISLVIAGQVFQSTATTNLTKVLAGTSFTDADIRGAIAGAKSQIFEEISGPLKEEAILAITQAMQKSLILVSVAGGVLTISGLLMKREKLFGDIVQGGA
ncbi:major facilitator superfamily domain-containing protein [Trichoderma barbatum]